VMLGTFQLLLLGEGDGAEFVLALGGKDKDGDLFTQWMMYFATVVFCICVLNLFIAVHGSSYQAAHAMVKQSFYKSRARICVDALIHPQWTHTVPENPMLAYVLLIIFTVSAWLCIIFFLTEVHPVVASLLLVASLHFGDRLLLRRPWRYVSHDVVHPEGDVTPSKGAYKGGRVSMGVSKTVATFSAQGEQEDLYLWWCEWEEEEDEWGNEVDDRGGALRGPGRDVANGWRQRQIQERLDFLAQDVASINQKICNVDAVGIRLEQISRQMHEQQDKDEEFRAQILQLLGKDASACTTALQLATKGKGSDSTAQEEKQDEIGGARTKSKSARLEEEISALTAARKPQPPQAVDYSVVPSVLSLPNGVDHSVVPDQPSLHGAAPEDPAVAIVPPGRMDSFPELLT